MMVRTLSGHGKVLGSLSEFQVRDMNDQINRLMRERRAWEHRITELGGPNYRVIPPKAMQSMNNDPIMGAHGGYRYYGRAKDLPGVKELFGDPGTFACFRMHALDDASGKNAKETFKYMDSHYYGYHDEDIDRERLLAYEAEVEKRRKGVSFNVAYS